MQHSEIKTSLLEFYNETAERVGFVLTSGEIVEVTNVCTNPAEGFDVSAEDIIKYEGQVVSTWHTHPNATSNLSLGDYTTFMAWEDCDHYIVGNNGVSRFVVQDGDVLIA